MYHSHCIPLQVKKSDVLQAAPVVFWWFSAQIFLSKAVEIKVSVCGSLKYISSLKFLYSLLGGVGELGIHPYCTVLPVGFLIKGRPVSIDIALPLYRSCANQRDQRINARKPVQAHLKSFQLSLLLFFFPLSVKNLCL